MSKRLVNLITLVIVIILIFVAYRYFVVAPAEEEPAGVTVSTGEEPNTTSAEFLDLLNSVKSLTLSKSLFSNLVFRDRLQDFSRPLPERSVGRGNPFAPFGQGGTTTSRLFGGSGGTSTSSPASTATSTTPKTATSTTAAKPATSTPAAPAQGNFNF